ncbi:mediator of RNA polymerase II transcription subunit 15 isoform X2 [Dunckerocampus dactyliophorus]|uniref:mediator of RNA polymerase II transcription subunit 15 isoform X2 n=1 Tax=Dunckerocampus dactyliophorus TaxID=161453 RepID=UPI0024071E3D|nr:mediator of RNA polymerase II transcription subunit 15 isoform X2 [Dunckerocampus dactyliophorus]
MEVPGPDSDWRSPQFRQKVVSQIEDAMRKAGTGHNKSSNEMENHVYVKAKSREEYLSLVARLIIHYRDIHNKTLGGPDPMNALTNLTGVGGGSGAIGMGPHPTGAPVGGMGAMGPMQIGPHAMAGVSGNPQALGGPAQLAMQGQSIPFQQFQQQNPMQQQQQQQQQFQVQQMRAQQQQIHQNQQQAQNQQQQNQMHQSRMQQQMVQLQLQQHAQAQSIQHMVQHQQVQAQPGPMPPHSQQQATMAPQPLAGQMTSAQHVPINSLSQQQHHLKMQAFQARAAMQQQATVQAQLASVSGQLVRPNMQIPARLPRPTLAPSVPPPNTATAAVTGPPMTQQVQQQHVMMSSPSPVQVQTPQSMPPPPQPSPQPPASQPNSVSSGPTPSPGGFQPSPSPQPSQSPSTARTPQNYGVSSPGPLSTPGNPNSVMSPAGAASQEDQQYMEKRKQLSKYIEPLRRMINKIDKNEERKKDLSKMKSLLNILTDPNTRCPLKTLQKCEIALEKLKNDMAVPTPPPPPLTTKQQYLCQPLLDAVMANLRSPVFNHSLHRTFAPAMTAIHGPPIIGPNVSARKRKQEDDERQTVPNILQGEVARLDIKFLVHLDPAHCSNNGTVHLVCRLEDKNLPSVPPLQLSVPADYPDQSPYWANDGEEYGANHFLQTVQRNMASKLLQLPDKHSVTEVLHTWAQSVRQACLAAA